MTTNDAVTITAADRDDLEPAVQILSHAFHGDPVIAATLGGDPRTGRARGAHLFRALALSGPLVDGTLDIARDGDRVVGAAMWFAPGRGQGSMPHGMTDALEFLRAFGILGIRRALRVSAVLDRQRPARPHWFLESIGVHPEGHGRGIGSRLLAHRLTTADAAGDPAYLDASSTRSRDLYGRHGFELLRPFAVARDVTAYSMWREPRE